MLCSPMGKSRIRVRREEFEDRRREFDRMNMA
jgi:hypothetical protein